METLQQERRMTKTGFVDSFNDVRDSVSDVIDDAIGAVKQVGNDLIASQRAMLAEYLVDNGVVQVTDTTTGEKLAPDEVAERYRETSTFDISDAEINGANAIKSMPAYGSVLLAAETAATKGRNIVRDPESLASNLEKKGNPTKIDSAMAKSLRTMKRFKVPCFEPGTKIKGKFKGNERELESHFARQLKHQESGLNDLTVGEYIENRNRYKQMKRAGTGMAQEQFRKRFSNDLNDSLEMNFLKKMSPIKAEMKATARTNEIMANLAALHDPDMIAGGEDKVSRMGNKGVNSSLGSQWRTKSRLVQMDKQAQRALETLGPDAKMNVSLERCPLRGSK
ncbi:hypothetical protein TUM4438_45980 [Shewanella sairae]|uniref:Novel toxin 15 domain-containing protein n=1 Tax=Shewanella sairae TaxID=190310 RepID=A0ABQ4PSB7_9GAMM|nr:polymorphic toxin type 15 domain-containing protein [Shewanella sairae]MCL1132655.1 polymorphic toxin type 15 domain-containing protein [Shewanella sairae]GIU52683.1 hypothetical protein TUM4438_45980 [Shewanella sairae]